MEKVSLIMCSEMHMDIEQANELLSAIYANKNSIICTDYTEADTIVIMTCAFGRGVRYSMYVIADVLRNCKDGARIVVTGELVMLYNGQLTKIPRIEVKTLDEVFELFGRNILMKFLKQNKVIISKGCKKKCSYCVYPLICDEYVSKPKENILEEIEELYDVENTIYISGALETSDYGIDLYGKRTLSTLIDEICTRYPDCNYVIGWLHPSGLTDEFISVVAKHENISEVMVHIQHVNNKILTAMNRPSFEYTNARIVKLKEFAPHVLISTEVIVGFSGETESEFNELVNYLDSGLFHDIGVASYEPVLGTKAARLKDIPSLETSYERMQAVNKRYKYSTAYPAPEKRFVPILEYFLEACEVLDSIPHMLVLTADEREKYPFIASVDTRQKMPEEFGNVLTEIYNEIVSARDSLNITKLTKRYSLIYTLDFRKFVYQVLKNTKMKPQMLEKAKQILLF